MAKGGLSCGGVVVVARGLRGLKRADAQAERRSLYNVYFNFLSTLALVWNSALQDFAHITKQP